MATITEGPAGRCLDLNDDNWHTIYTDADGCTTFRAENEAESAAPIEVCVNSLHGASGPGETLAIGSGKAVWRHGVRQIKTVQVRRSPSNTDKVCKFNWGVAGIVPER